MAPEQPPAVDSASAPPGWATDLERLGLQDAIRLQHEISVAIRRRFERGLALAFTDVEGSTAYFQRFGNEAGSGLLRRHVEILTKTLAGRDGRIVDTAGDGAFLCFSTVPVAVDSLVELQRSVAGQNVMFPPEHRLLVRSSVHFGNVLTDGKIVTGDAVNLCSRAAGVGHGEEIIVTDAAFHKLPSTLRSRCHALPPATLKGIRDPVEVFRLEWRDPMALPNRVHLLETDEVFELPSLDVIRFGRLKEIDGKLANHVVLKLPDDRSTLSISRWHFELRRVPAGFVLRRVSPQSVEVDGVAVELDADTPVRHDTVVRISGVLTLVFEADLHISGPEFQQTMQP